MEQPDEAVIDGKTVRQVRTFYRGENANFWPTEDSFARDDSLREYCAKGVMPEAPFISADTVVVAFGSCFAKHISDHLAGLRLPHRHRIAAAATRPISPRSATAW